MQSEFNQWLTQLSELAAQENIIVEAKYFDGLDYFFKAKLSPSDALPKYKDLVDRVLAIWASPLTKMWPNSSNVSSTSYHPSNQKLEVAFTSGTYQYSDVQLKYGKPYAHVILLDLSSQKI